MRKIDKAFSDSLKAPGNVIPIQDVLLVRIEPLARYRPHAILAIRDNAYLSFRASPSLSCYRLNVLFGTAILVQDGIQPSTAEVFNRPQAATSGTFPPLFAMFLQLLPYYG